MRPDFWDESLILIRDYAEVWVSFGLVLGSFHSFGLALGIFKSLVKAKRQHLKERSEPKGNPKLTRS